MIALKVCSMWRQQSTLRARLLLGMAAAMAVVLALSGVAIYGFVRASLFSEFDGALASSARVLAATVEQEGSHVKMEVQGVAWPEFSRTSSPEYFAAWLGDGRPLGQSASLAG